MILSTRDKVTFPFASKSTARSTEPGIFLCRSTICPGTHPIPSSCPGPRMTAPSSHECALQISTDTKLGGSQDEGKISSFNATIPPPTAAVVFIHPNELASSAPTEAGTL